MKNLVAVSTSQSTASLAFFREGQLQTEEINTQPKTHSDWIHEAFVRGLRESGLNLSNLDGLALDIGPGSFTGLRVGLNLVKPLSYALQIPVLSATSLETLLGSHEAPVYAAINAFKNSVYVAGFEVDGSYLAPQVLPARQFVEKLSAILEPQDVLVVGDAWTSVPSLKDLLRTRQFRRPSLPQEDFPQAKVLGEQALVTPQEYWTKDWKSLLPLYLRASEAEEAIAKS